jgi:hypothetical protein
MIDYPVIMNVIQHGDALALLRLLPEAYTPLVFFDPQHRASKGAPDIAPATAAPSPEPAGAPAPAEPVAPVGNDHIDPAQSATYAEEGGHDASDPAEPGIAHAAIEAGVSAPSSAVPACRPVIMPPALLPHEPWKRSSELTQALRQILLRADDDAAVRHAVRRIVKFLETRGLEPDAVAVHVTRPTEH